MTIQAGIVVHKALGPGLLEFAYRACLAFELRSMGLEVEVDKRLPLVYREVSLDCGYRLDVIVGQRVIVEVKCVTGFAPVHLAQLLTYLKLTGCPVGLLLNFHVPVLKDGVRRVINTNVLKSTSSR